jgi:2-keto-4-pentenoate hydratase/2-oxohepta-3-ene-1,7-dioic acid hydratase in catechol pathway
LHEEFQPEMGSPQTRPIESVTEALNMKIIRQRTADGAIGHAVLHPDGKLTRLDGDLFGRFADSGEPVEPAKLLAPLQPPAILCIGLNYRQHAAESGSVPPEHPVLFMKTPAALQHPGEPILLPTHLASTKVDYECELAVVIGRPCKNVGRHEALDYVLGYTCANDVSARDWQGRWGGGQWCRGKTFDTFCPLGPCLVTTDEIPNPNALGIKTTLNDEVMQDWNTNDMIFDVPALIEFLSGSTTLLPGTVILTGTPHGVGFARSPHRFLQPGDSVTIEIQQIGQLTNPVELEQA